MIKDDILNNHTVTFNFTIKKGKFDPILSNSSDQMIRQAMINATACNFLELFGFEVEDEYRDIIVEKVR